MNLVCCGQHLTESFWFAGGIPAVQWALRDHLDLSVMTVTGKTLGENLDALETVDYDFYTAAGKRMDNPEALDYQTFINGYIMVNYEEYPQHPDFIANKSEHRQKRKSAAEKGALKAIEQAAEKEAQEGQ